MRRSLNATATLRPASRSGTPCIAPRRCRVRPILPCSLELLHFTFIRTNRVDPIMNKLCSLVLLGFLMWGADARAEFVVEVTRGQTQAIPIAVVPFASAAETAASFDVAQMISEDLARSGRFKTMDV